MKKFRGHQPHHQFEILVDPSFDHISEYKWLVSFCSLLAYSSFIIANGAKYVRSKPRSISKLLLIATSLILSSLGRCDHCFEFYFCEKCYLKREGYKPNLATSHKSYHNFTRLNAS